MGRYTEQRDANAIALGKRLSEHTVGASEIPGDVKAICFNADGTADITNDDDSTVAGVPVVKMVPMVVVPKKVTAMATATKCYLIR
jgi:hypothetical protein